MTAQAVLDVLRAARVKLATSERWTKGPPRAANGAIVPADSLRAVCWCTVTAIHVASGKNAVLSAKAVRRVQSVVPPGFGGSASGYNNAPATTHADILALFDRAIAVEGS